MAVSYDELTLIADLFGDAPAESERVFSQFGLTTVDLVTIGQTAFEKRLGLLFPETICLFWDAIVVENPECKNINKICDSSK